MTGFESARRVHAVQDHVRQNLQGDLGLDALADLAGVSRFHFARLFKVHAGETLNHFVRRARLERAAALMRARPERRLLEVALDAGFDSAGNFSRVFRQHYGIAPRRWDRGQRLEAVIQGYEDGLSSARASCPPLNPVVRRHPPCRLAYARVATPFLDAGLLEKGYRTLLSWLAARGVDGSSLPLLGMSWDQPETAPLDQIRFDLAVPIPDGLRTDGPVSELRLPEIRSVEVRVNGELPHVALAWDHLYAWLAESSEAPADLPTMKRFHGRPEELGWFRVDLDCCIALD